MERANQTLQDRLVKEMRLRGISDMAAGNAYLPEFMADFNRRFAAAPRNPEDAHRAVLRDAAELDLIFCEHHRRKLTKNLTITSPAHRRAPFGAGGQPVDNALGRLAVDRAFPPRVARRLPTLARLSPTTPQLKQQVFSSRRREKSEPQKGAFLLWRRGDISTLR